MNLRLCGWDGSHIGRTATGENVKWGVHRSITSIQNVSIIKVLDSDGMASVIDEISGIFGLCKTGTFRYKHLAYDYCAYSFMHGEEPYISRTDYELNELCDRWMIYYSWWNISLKWDDMYMRKRYDMINRMINEVDIVVYPSACFKIQNISEAYALNAPNCMNSDSPRSSHKHMSMMVRSWLGCYNETDINNIINMKRPILEAVIKRISPSNISIVGIIVSRIRNFLLYYISNDD